MQRRFFVFGLLGLPKKKEGLLGAWSLNRGGKHDQVFVKRFLEKMVFFLGFFSSQAFRAQRFRQAGYNEKTDIWSFGVMAYALLFNEFPYGPQVREKDGAQRFFFRVFFLDGGFFCLFEKRSIFFNKKYWARRLSIRLDITFGGSIGKFDLF